MQTLTVKINFNPQTQAVIKDFVGSPSPSKTAAELTEGDGLVMELGTGWPRDSYINLLQIGQIENGVFTTICYWDPPDASPVFNLQEVECFEISPNAPTPNGPNTTPNPTPNTICLLDTESPFVPSPYGYRVWVHAGSLGDFQADPEVINKSGDDNPQWGDPVVFEEADTNYKHPALA